MRVSSFCFTARSDTTRICFSGLRLPLIIVKTQTRHLKSFVSENTPLKALANDTNLIL